MAIWVLYARMVNIIRRMGVSSLSLPRGDLRALFPVLLGSMIGGFEV